MESEKLHGHRASWNREDETLRLLGDCVRSQGHFLVSHSHASGSLPKGLGAIEGFRQGLAWLALPFLKVSQAAVWGRMGGWSVREGRV